MSTPIIEGAKVMSKGQITSARNCEKLGSGPWDRSVLVWDDGQVARRRTRPCLRSRRCRPRCGERRRRLGSESEDDLAGYISDMRAESRAR